MKRWLILIPIFLMACSSADIIRTTDSPTARRVEGNRIFVGDELYAEILLICKDDISDRYKGIAIHYVDGDRYEWISPEEGWTLIRENQKVNDIEQLKRDWVWDRHPDYSKLNVLKGTKKLIIKHIF